MFMNEWTILDYVTDNPSVKQGRVQKGGGGPDPLLKKLISIGQNRQNIDICHSQFRMSSLQGSNFESCVSMAVPMFYILNIFFLMC